MKKTISIIIATYNAASILPRCLDSIVGQLTEECELLIIDGGSKDSTKEVIASYKKYIAYTVSEPDDGIYSAWNKGIRASNGDWIGFIGADDCLCPGTLEMYLNLIHSYSHIDEYDYICARVGLVTENGSLAKEFGSEPKWSSMRYGMCAAHCMSLHSRNRLFNTVGLFDTSLRICADYELLLRKRDKLKYLFIPKVVVMMQIGGTSFSAKGVRETYRIRKEKRTISAIENLYKYFGTLMGVKTYRWRNKYHLLSNAR